MEAAKEHNHDAESRAIHHSQTQTKELQSDKLK